MANGHSETALLEFITAAKSHGAGDQFLVNLLSARGWPEKSVYQAFLSYYETATGLRVPGRAGAAESAKDAFLYLLAFGTLGTWSGSLGSLLYTLIDRWVPDPVSPAQFTNSDIAIASSMAGIIVAFPIYIWITALTIRETNRNPGKLESGVRKWLTYIALLVAACFLIGDLITFLTHLLRGELTARFVSKAMVVFTIAGGIFSYYLSSLGPRDRPNE